MVTIIEIYSVKPVQRCARRLRTEGTVGSAIAQQPSETFDKVAHDAIADWPVAVLVEHGMERLHRRLERLHHCLHPAFRLPAPGAGPG
jgi:hypothetical protein